MKNAVRGRLLLLDPPVPTTFLEKARISYEELHREVRWEEVAPAASQDLGGVMLVPNPDEIRRQRVVENVSEEVSLEAAVRLVDGRVAVPRWLLSDRELEQNGYRVWDCTASNLPQHPELLEAPKTRLRDHQLSPFAHALHEGRGVLQLGTGRGKTVLALRVIAHYAQPALVFVDTEDLMHQWVQRAVEHLGLPEDRIGTLRGSVNDWRWEGLPLTLALAQSWYTQVSSGRIPPEIFDAFGVVIWDELHAFQGEVMATTSMGLLSGRRFGLTATPHRDERARIYMDHIGPVIYKDLTTDHVPSVFFHAIEVPPKKTGGRDYVAMASTMLGSSRRAPLPQYVEGLLDLLLSLRERGRTVLAITPRKRVGRELASRMDDLSVIDAGVQGERRLERLNSCQTVVVINSLGEKALDRKDVDAVVYVIPPGKQAIDRIMQGAGRGLRSKEGKEDAELHFCYPETHYGRQLAVAAARNCEELGYNVVDPPSRRSAKPPRSVNNRMTQVMRKFT